MNLKKYKKLLIVGLIVSGFSLLLVGIFFLILHGIGSGLVDGRARERFERGDLRYTQVSCFLSEDINLSASRMRYLDADIEKALTTDSYGAPDGSRVFLSAYSSERNFHYAGKKGSADAVRTFCVGGDFFYFHPIQMSSGWYFTGDELMETGVILDENLAWQLFGALDVSGMSVEVGGIHCTVLGVTKGPEGKPEKKEYGSAPTAYIPYALASRLSTEEIPVTRYEAVLPDPVDGYGMKLFRNTLNLKEGEYHYVENTNRYSALSVVKGLKNTKDRILRTDNIVYPYWENAARLADNRAHYIGILLVIFILPPILYLLFWIVLLFNRKEILVKGAVHHVSDAYTTIRKKIRQKKEKKA